MHIQEAIKEIRIIAQYDQEQAISLVERYQRIYPNFTSHLRGYHLADHTGDYRVNQERRVW